MTENNNKWRFWIDRGGTFTDIVAKDPGDTLRVHKLLSENPEQYSDAAIQGVRDLLELEPDEAIPGAKIAEIKMGTTVGTNALLERQGERVALAITSGFGDLLRIGYQNRPDIFALKIKLPEMLYECVLEIDERVKADGEVLRPLDREKAKRELRGVLDMGIRSLAIVLAHSYRYPKHEIEVARIAEELGFENVSVSHRVIPLMKIVGRGDTTVLDAYLSPLLKRYVAGVKSGLSDNSVIPRLLFMQSHGGLTNADFFRGKDSVLSGPAGGIVGAVTVSSEAGFKKIITFDMGGTSTDVAHYAGEMEHELENEIAGVRVRSPMLRIHTVAAGGGSILHFDGLRFRVGPDSAGANPGPACYRRGGPLCVTDANLVLGRIIPDFFPKVFGVQGNQSLDKEATHAKFAEMTIKVNDVYQSNKSAEDLAEDFFNIAIENMAYAIKHISVRRGYDLKDYALCCFGGAGGQHACRIADALGMKKILLHPFAGVLSAFGMGLAKESLMRQQSVEKTLSPSTMANLHLVLEKMESEGVSELREHLSDSWDDRKSSVRKNLLLRYDGTGTSFPVKFGNLEEMLNDFERQHHQRFSFLYDDKDIIVETAELTVEYQNERISGNSFPSISSNKPKAIGDSRLFAQGMHYDCSVFSRHDIGPGSRMQGPAIIVEECSTIVIDPDWAGLVNSGNQIVLERKVAVDGKKNLGTKADPALLELFNNRFMSIAEQMGYALRNTASSVNIRERLDFSCAVFDQNGALVANAPHIPVHLGSMPDSVRAILERFRDEMAPGDAFLLNSPYHGGTHLPDITVVTPVFDAKGNDLIFFTASRGHHADIGGETPGSMPADSVEISEEGVLSSGLRVIHRGDFNEEAILDWLSSSQNPARNPRRNIADLRAQVAANEKGSCELRALVETYSLPTIKAYMGHVMDNAEESVRRALEGLREGDFSLRMDNGGIIRVSIKIDSVERSAVIDFTGSSPQLKNNFNAPNAVVKAAVLYVFRCLTGEDIPLNSGCMKPLQLIIPSSSMLNPQAPAAVVAGNVETSQHLVDAIFGALGVLACSQGTMNNFTFGDGDFQYYETVCGGCGAGRDFRGADAVHSHMTNSRITDPEVLEDRFPVVLERFAIRKGSGGIGRQSGGDGVIREIRFLKSMSASILSSHRQNPPFGLEGANPGLTGENLVRRKTGEIIKLGAAESLQMESGDVFIIKTPGGGGFGS